MQYRKFGKLDWKASILGFGCMRLPVVGEGANAKVDDDEAARLIRHAIDQGVNYMDTAYIYHNGYSEVALGKALGDGYRERVKIADKAPLMTIKAEGDFDRILDEQLKRLNTDHIDFYLMHGVNRENWDGLVVKFNLLEKAAKAKADGRIRHLGFSFHDSYDQFEKVLNATDAWEFCQIQYNYMDVKNQAGKKGLQAAAAKGLAVVVMEPLMGGRLTAPPQDVSEAMAQHATKRTPAEWALGWLWDQPEVTVVLSGMSTMAQVDDNLRIADQARPGVFTAADQELVATVREKYRARTKIPCTACKYCLPCPNGVMIPVNFEIYNRAFLYDDLKAARVFYTAFMQPQARSTSCLECGECEERCPQHIHISEWMPKVTELLAAK